MSMQQIQNQIIPRGVIWEHNIKTTQPAGAPSPSGFKIQLPEGERGIFYGILIGTDDYGAGRVIQATIRNVTTGNILYHIATDTIDNEFLRGPPILASITETSITLDTMGLPYMPFLLTEKHEIRIVGTSLVSAETLTAVLYIATRILPSVITAVGAAVVVTTNTAFQV